VRAAGELGTPEATSNGKRPLSPENAGKGKRLRRDETIEEVVLGALRLEVVGRLYASLPPEVAGLRCVWEWGEDEAEDAPYGMICIEASTGETISFNVVECDVASKLVQELEGQDVVSADRRLVVAPN
jgi:hypothetical protein